MSSGLNKDHKREEHHSLQTRVSIVIPVYNAEKYLSRCLESIRSQSMSAFEAICIDDGSTDGSAAILKDFAEKDSRFVVVSQENRGLASTRNRGIGKACGEWITFVDADDFVSSDYLEKLLAAFEKTHTDTPEIVRTRDVINVPGENVRYDYSQFPDLVEGLKDRLALLLAQVVWGSLYRRDFLDRARVRFVEGVRNNEDLFFSMRAFASAKRCALASGAKYFYRVTGTVPGQLSSQKAMTPALIRSYELISEDIDTYCIPKKEKDVVRRFFKSFICKELQNRFSCIRSFEERKMFLARLREVGYKELDDFPLLPDAIISLTSYPPRIPYVAETVRV